MELIEATKRPRHPADGGGRAWLEPAPDGSGLAAKVGAPGHFTIVYEAGPLGIARDASLYFQVPFNWSWSPPQFSDLDGPGFTMVTSTARGLRLEPAVVDQGLLQIRIRGRALAAGERVRIDYGVGSARAAVDRFAERETRFFIAVDGDGDGWRDWIADSPKLDVAPGPPARLTLFLPATARPGEKLALHAALLAENGDAGVAFEGTLRLTLPPGVEGPSELAIGSEAGGLAQAELRYDGRGHRARPGGGPGRPRGREQPVRGHARRPARAVRRPPRPLEPVGRHRHARGLLPLRPRRRGTRRGRAHRPRPLGHALPRRDAGQLVARSRRRRSASTSPAAS